MEVPFILYLPVWSVLFFTASTQPVCQNLNLLQCAEILGARDYVNYVKQLVISNKYEYKGNKTLFAPLDSAFKSVPVSVQKQWSTDGSYLRNTILYHLAFNRYQKSELTNNLILNTYNPGNKLRVNTYQVGQETITTINGGKLLEIPESVTDSGILLLVPAVFYRFPAQTVVDYTVGNSNFSTLLLVIAETGLTNTFEGDNITVLAPSDDAFDKLPEGTLPSLLKDVTKLRQILLNHIISNVWYSAGLENKQTIKAMSGTNITVDTNGTVQFNTSKVVEADIPVGNGVIHVIDTVLL